MAEQLANNAAGTLSANMLIGATSCTLNAGQGAAFPSTGNFRILIGSELMLVGARATDTLSSITRGIEGTSAAAHNSGDAVTHILTQAGLLQYIQDNSVQKPASIASAEWPVWNGSAWARSSVTPGAVAGLAPGSNGQFLQTTGGVTVWGASPAIAPTHLPGMIAANNNTAVTANTAYLIPIGNVVVSTSISRIIWDLVTVVAGNYDVGVYYSDDEATFTLLGAKGSTAQPAAGNIITSLSTQTLAPVSGRRWYYAIALSTASTVGMGGSSGSSASAVPAYSKATSFPLPATITSPTAAGAAPFPAVHGAV